MAVYEMKCLFYNAVSTVFIIFMFFAGACLNASIEYIEDRAYTHFLLSLPIKALAEIEVEDI